MEELIAIALMYSYIVNGNRELPDYTINAFVLDVKKSLTRLRSKYDISEKNSRGFFDSIPCTINVRSEDGETRLWNSNDKNVDPRSRGYANQPIFYYSFASIDRDFVRWISYLDQDLICATLDREALSHLDVKREELPIKSSEIIRSGEMSIYSLMESEAREKALRYLEEDGYKDVAVSSRGIPVQIDDKAYKFYFTGRKDMFSLDTYRNSIFEKMANLKTILDMEAYKKEVLSKVSENGRLNLENIFLANTVLLDKDNNIVSRDYCAVIKLTGDEDSFYNRVVASLPTGGSDVTVFINVFGDEVMNFFWQGKFGDKKFERVVEDIELLSSSMNMESATLEEIEHHIDKINNKPTRKCLLYTTPSQL
ncbi:MAG: hypothetical protein K2G03_03650, partial [Bacilli bacterium]|nr:hypothetical protein [Bacilli bacterium]